MARLDDLLAAGVRLDPAVLDAIDEVVPPGTDIAGIKHVTETRPSPRKPPLPPLTRHDGTPRPPVAVTEAREMR